MPPQLVNSSSDIGSRVNAGGDGLVICGGLRNVIVYVWNLLYLHLDVFESLSIGQRFDVDHDYLGSLVAG